MLNSHKHIRTHANIIWVWLRYLKLFVTEMLYDYVILIETIIVLAGVLGYGFVLGILKDIVFCICLDIYEALIYIFRNSLITVANFQC